MPHWAVCDVSFANKHLHPFQVTIKNSVTITIRHFFGGCSVL